eukprot:scaffold1052_cov339-Pavlova_lutheri.AAC.41
MRGDPRSDGPKGGHSEVVVMASVSAGTVGKLPAICGVQATTSSRKRVVLRHVVPKEVLQAYLKDGIDDGKVGLEDLQRALQTMETDGLLKGNWSRVDALHKSGSALDQNAGHRTQRSIPMQDGTNIRGRMHGMVWTAIGVFLVTFLMGIAGVAIEGLAHRTSLSSVPFIVGSYGTLSILFFCAPGSSLIKPWNLLAGHVLCCTVAVICMQILPLQLTAMGVAEVHRMTIIRSVAMAISTYLMLKLDAVHPPGGALVYILCDTVSLQEFGWGFILYPGLTGAICLVFMVSIFTKFVQSMALVQKEEHIPAMPV